MSVSGPKRTFALCCRISARSEADNGRVRTRPARTTCVANRANMRFCRSAETRLARGRLPITVCGDPKAFASLLATVRGLKGFAVLRTLNFSHMNRYKNREQALL